jgi:hypothetical protein
MSVSYLIAAEECTGTFRGNRNERVFPRFAVWVQPSVIKRAVTLLKPKHTLSNPLSANYSTVKRQTMTLLDTRTLRNWGGPVVFAFVAVFTLTILLLHASLEAVDDEDLLSKTNDWRQSHFPKVDQVGSRGGVRNKHSVGKAAAAATSLPRAAFEKDHSPSDLDRMRASVQALRQKSPPATQTNMTYDILNCPDQPPSGYPQAWSAMSVLTEWNPDNTDIPDTIYQGLCVFDWTKTQDRQKVHTYRQAEQPFVLQNHPDVLRVAERWNSPNYLEEMLGQGPQRTDHATTNHLMFSRVIKGDKLPDNWKPPIDIVALSYSTWLQKAQELEHAEDQASKEHWYLRKNTVCKANGVPDVLCDELPFFNPVENLFIVSPSEYRGINCRWGMKGSIAPTHYDNSRNWLMLFGGQRRYVLAHPSQCKNLELYPGGHPSARHASQDWSKPVGTKEFLSARLNEVVLDAGDALYLPTAWFHFIVSLNINYQCNTRSGQTRENAHFIEECGFQV